MDIILVVIAFALIAGFQTPGLIKKKEWKDLVVFGILWLTGFVLSFLLSLNVQLPSPAKMIMSLWDSIGLHF
jgi:hypothetical protein